MWTKTAYRKQGIARRMMEMICERVPGQHVYLAADDDVLEFYAKLGFTVDGHGMARVVGQWLHNKTRD
jgi:GNAT superfamily N-acetyltransferase